MQEGPAAPLPEADYAANDAGTYLYTERVLNSLRRMMRANDVRSRRLYIQHKITVPQILCLHELLHEKSMMLTVLANRVHLGLSTVNGIVDRLEAKGWVKRARSPIDNRRVYIELTETGRELTANAPSVVRGGLYEALRKLPELEQAAIALSLERLLELMEEIPAVGDFVPTAITRKRRSEHDSPPLPVQDKPEA